MNERVDRTRESKGDNSKHVLKADTSVFPNKKYMHNFLRREIIDIPRKAVVLYTATRVLPIATTLSACASLSFESQRISNDELLDVHLTPQHLLPAKDFRLVSPAIRSATEGLLGFQKDDGYFLTRSGEEDIVPMDNAHAILALAKVGKLSEAKKATLWFLEKLTDQDDLDAVKKIIVKEKESNFSYVGSWHDQMNAKGKRMGNAERGRGEGVGLMLIALNAIHHEDSAFLGSHINGKDGKQVKDAVVDMVTYLHSLQRPDGTFIHRPNYDVAFVEENVRMSVGLDLASRMLRGEKYHEKAQLASDCAKKGIDALRIGEGLNIGMSYDYMPSMWGIGNARDDMKKITASGLLTDSGIRVYDWQKKKSTDPRKFLKYYLGEQVNGTSETLEGLIVAAHAGDARTATRLMNHVRSLQLENGTFPNGYISTVGPFNHVSIGPPPAYATARYIMAELVLEELAYQIGT